MEMACNLHTASALDAGNQHHTPVDLCALQAESLLHGPPCQVSNEVQGITAGHWTDVVRHSSEGQVVRGLKELRPQHCEGRAA